jgi:hypothetical protein
MDSNNVKSKTFLGAVAAAIKAVCMLIIDLVVPAQEGVAMLNKAVVVARQRQAVELDIVMNDFEQRAWTAAAQAQAAEQEKVEEWANTPRRRELMEANIKRLKKAVEDGQAEIRRERESRTL